MQQARHDCFDVDFQSRQQNCDFQGMGDVGLSRFSRLPVVGLVGESERTKADLHILRFHVVPDESEQMV